MFFFFTFLLTCPLGILRWRKGHAAKFSDWSSIRDVTDDVIITCTKESRANTPQLYIGLILKTKFYYTKGNTMASEKMDNRNTPLPLFLSHNAMKQNVYTCIFFLQAFLYLWHRRISLLQLPYNEFLWILLEYRLYVFL